MIFPSGYGAKTTINQTMNQAYKGIKITSSKKKYYKFNQNDYPQC